MPAACSSRRIPALCTLLLSSLVRTYRKAPATSGWWLPCSTCGFFFSCDSLGPKETLWPQHHHWPTWHWPAMRCLWTSAMKLQAPQTIQPLSARRQLPGSKLHYQLDRTPPPAPSRCQRTPQPTPPARLSCGDHAHTCIPKPWPLPPHCTDQHGSSWFRWPS